MIKQLITALLLLTLSLATFTTLANSRWGSDYFPNIELTTHEGKKVRFFDDLIKDKIVVINFIYTTCPDTCPLETAHLVRVQRIMGDRIGKDVFFYSISIDPDTDTPAVLKQYRQRFKANWTFLTGDEVEIVQLRKKLGLYIAEIQDGSNNHNVSMIIGNQKTGRWMKRSPFENAHVLANQIGSWLNDFKAPSKGDSYANAPQLRNISTGEQLFRTRCVTCHSLTGHEAPDALGPDLIGVNQKRSQFWLLNWLRSPDKMIANKDPIALALLKQYNNLAMPNMRLNQLEAKALLRYIEQQTQAVTKSFTKSRANGATENRIVRVVNPWIRAAHQEATTNAGYFTLINPSDKNLTLISATTPAFKQIEFHQMTTEDGLMQMQALKTINIPANGHVNFKPGGKHLMLHQPKHHLKQGDTIELELSFKSGKTQKVIMEVGG